VLRKCHFNVPEQTKARVFSCLLLLGFIMAEAAVAAPRQTRDERDVSVARKLFFAGCLLLPWLWILLLIHYRRRYFERDCPAQLQKCKKLLWQESLLCWPSAYKRSHLRPSPPPLSLADLRWSLIGALLESALLIVWIAVFQSSWRSFGDTGTNLLIYQPDVGWWRN